MGVARPSVFLLLAGAVAACSSPDSASLARPGWTGQTHPAEVIHARAELMEHVEELMEPIDQAFLDDHPAQRRWLMLTLHEMDLQFEEADLYRLEFLPELERLRSHVDHLTDRGVDYFTRVSGLSHLVIFSPLVTDACLEKIATLKHLQTIDLQGSHLISRVAFDRMIQKLPKLVDIYPPFDRPLAEIYRAAEQKAFDNPP
ncbi:MAG: hypothetical protein EOP83_04235 [Verrucomicrobiaceae bacterium]|nr:MAG: hypothetical protein EOP83_04235 [Verrucomicrobiaceae bacterium]